MKRKTDIVPEIVIPRGYEVEDILDMNDDFDESPIHSQEVKVSFE